MLLQIQKMGYTFLKFRLLLWKNYMLQRRKILVTVIEIGLPVFFAVLLIFVRQKVHAKEVSTGKNYTSFHPYTFPGGMYSSFEWIY